MVSSSLRFAAILAASLVSGCSDDGSDGADTPTDVPLSFAADIHPILVMKCSDSSSQCHSATTRGPFQPGHAAPDTDDAYAQVTSTGVSGQLIYERILARVTTTGATSMPPPYANPPCEGAVGAPGCITEAELAKIQAWVDQGAPP